jgi:ABC-type transport system involved in multi-copper enzyme maturation permease subunit
MAIGTLARKDLRVLLRDTRAAIILLTMPLVFILVLGLALGEGFGQKPDDRLRISILNEDAGLPPSPGPFPGRPWSEVIRDDLNQTAGIRVEMISSREEAERLVRRGQRSAVLVFRPDFSERVHYCSFLDDKFLGGKPGYNPFFRDGVNLKLVGMEVLEDPKQVLAASIIKQVAQVSLLRVVMPWMVGKAFDKISDRQFIDEMGRRVEISTPIGKTKPLALLSAKNKDEVGKGVQDSLQQMFHKYNLQAKTWAALTRSEPVGFAAMMPAAWAAVPEASKSNLMPTGVVTTYESHETGLLDRGAVRYQILVPSYTVMFAFFLVLTVGWLFVAERRQGTILRLRAAPLTRGQILLGKLLPCYGISFVQGVFLLLAGWLIFGMKWGQYPALLLLVVATTSLAAVGLSLLVASVAKTESQVSIYGSLLVLVLGGISGCLMPRDQMPEQMQRISLLTPHAWALDAYQELLLKTPQLPNVFMACGVLTLFGLGFTALAWLLLRLD